jgi:hypothetical protein
MKIYLLSREIKIIKVDDNSSKLETQNTGIAIYAENTIYYDNQEPFQTILHEIFHFYIKRVGLNQMKQINIEVICDLFSSFIFQLICENGEDIMGKIKKFSEGIYE